MLYQTHHPFLFQFHPFTCSILSSSQTQPPQTQPQPQPQPFPLLLSPSSLSPPPPPPPLLSPLPPLQVGTEMECVEAAALKTSIRKEMAGKPSPQAVFDDLLWAGGFNGQNGVVCDDFSVDDLLDFSNEDGFVETEAEEDDKNKVKSFVSVSPLKQHHDPEKLNLCAKNELGAEPTSELSVPADDLENLEWLSHFVEDSFTEFTTPLPAGFIPVKPKTERKPDPETPLPEKLFFKSPVPAKARSKRTRTGGRVWSLGSPSLTESSSSSSSSSTSSSPTSPWLIFATTQNQDSVELVRRTEAAEPVGSVETLQKKPKRRLVDGSTSHPPRRCSHCGVQKTPQWRTGPNGAKTLCNACGVRFKSGRLLPEYRPACSPTFSSELHSNHHRKVLEMRRKKEDPIAGEPGVNRPPVAAEAGVNRAPVVRSF